MDFFDTEIDIPEVPKEDPFGPIPVNEGDVQWEDEFEFQNIEQIQYLPTFFKTHRSEGINKPKKWILDLENDRWVCGDLVVLRKDIPPNTHKKPRFVEKFLASVVANNSHE